MKIKLILIFFLFSACATAVEESRDVQIILANLKFKKLEKVTDLRATHDLYAKALPLMGSKGNQKINIGVIKLYARSLSLHDNVEQLEVFYPAIEKEPKYFKDLIKETIKDKKKQKMFLEHIKEYAAFVIRGNG